MKHIRQLSVSLLLLLTLGIFLPSCETNRGELIPVKTVDIYLLLYADLGNMGIGETKLISGGVNGIVLYRQADLVFYAYDRTCTMFPEHNEAVVEDPGFSGIFNCPECGSSYIMMNGAWPYEGPARYALVEYHASIQGDVLHIYN